jgi:hypothetical protein
MSAYRRSPDGGLPGLLLLFQKERDDDGGGEHHQRLRVRLYCIHKPHRSRLVKSTMTAISATLAIVFMASPYIARRRL